MSEPKQIDVRTRKPEAEWILVMDRFWLAATPEIYKWVSWTAALAAVSYVAEKTNNAWLGGLRTFLMFTLIFYFQAFFMQWEFTNLPWPKSPTGQRSLSWALSLLLAAGVNSVSLYAAFAFASAQGGGSK